MRARIGIGLAAAVVLLLAGWLLLRTGDGDGDGEGIRPPPGPAASPGPIAPPPPAPSPPPEAPAAPDAEPPPAEPDPAPPEGGAAALVPVASVTGRVLDARSDTPVPGARVRAIHGGSLGTGALLVAGAEANPLGTAVTDARGRFRLEEILAGEIVTLEAARPGFTAASEGIVLQAGAPGEREVVLRISPCGSVRGVVRFADGRPAPGATVHVLPADAADLLANPTFVRAGGGRTIRALAAAAGDDGSYTVDGLDRGGGYVAVAILEGFGRSAPAEGILPVDDAPEVVVDFTLVEGATFTVRILDPDGAPAPAPGTLLLFGEGFPLRFEEKGPGVYEVRRPPPGSYRLRVVVPGFLHWQEPVEVPAGEDREVEVRLERGVALEGILVDDTGAPLAERTLHASRPWQLAGKVRPSEGSGATDAKGRFRIEGLAPGPHVLSLRSRDNVVPGDRRFEVPALDVRVVAARTGGIRVRPRFPEGAVPAETLTLGIGREEDGGFSEGRQGALLEEGVARLDGIAAGPVRVRVSAPGYLEVLREIEIPPGAIADLGEIPLDPGLTLEGRVVDPQARPVAGAEVSPGDSWTMDRAAAVTGADGTFLLPHLPRGEAIVEVAADGFLPWEGTVSLPADAGHRIVLRRGGLLRGRVRDAQGAPAAGLDVRIVPLAPGEGEPGEAPEEEEYGETDHAGAFAVRVPPGRWSVRVIGADGEVAAEREVDAVEGVETEVPVELPPR